MNRAALALLAGLSLFVSGCTDSAAAATLDTSVVSAYIATATPATSHAALTPAAATATATPLTPFPITPTASPNELSTAYDDAASLVQQLAAGTLALDGTDQAVTKDQAVALLPLWDQYLSTMQAGSTPVATAASSASQDGELVDEIELMMTPSQLRAVADLEITQQAAADILAEVTPAAQAAGSITGTSAEQLVSALIAYLQQLASA